MASSAERPHNNDEGVPDEPNGNHASESASGHTQPPSSSPGLLKRASTTPTIPHLSAPSSAATSPRPSREGSPTRPTLKSGMTTASRATRSRKNSQDLSPIRAPSASGIPTVPSAAAIQRALSAAGTPHLPSPARPDFSLDSPQPQKPQKASIGGPGLKIPRVSSPPPSTSSGTNKSVLPAARKIDQSQSTPTTPSIVVERPARSSTFASDSDAAEEDRAQKSGMRTPVRGMSGNGPGLETVQESSLPSTPAIGGGRSGQTNKAASNDRPERIEENPMEDAFGKEAKSRPESGSESAGKNSIGGTTGDDGKDARKPPAVANTSKPPVVQPKKSFTQLPFTKAPKAGAEGSVKNMTVETETVSSIPQVALGGGTNERNTLGRTETTGSLRLKPSNETIRPKKEKKKAVRKAPSLNAGNGSPIDLAYDPMSEHDKSRSALLPGKRVDKHKHVPSADLTPEIPPGPPRRTRNVLMPFRARIASSKADIFEAKLINAVDEANSSDSEETFVYESNPPEQHSARPHRFHSRTPSATSTASHYDAKSRQDGHHSVVGKKSMKFANNYNSIGYTNDGEGTVRGPSQTGRNVSNSTPHHHHIGRFGRGGHTSLFDSDSPFPNATKSTQTGSTPLSRSPRLSSPRTNHVIHVTKSPRKAEEVMSYDLEGEGADDERAPLIGSNRIGRNRRRPLPGSVRQMYSENKGRRLCRRVTAWTTLAIVITTIIAAVVAAVILCSKTLIDVHIKDIRNVLASEQEIMLDLHVHAINPNIMAIQVTDLDINIFAKSKYVGTSELWRSHQPHNESSEAPPKPGKVRINSPKSPPFISEPSDIISQLDGIDEGTDPIDDPATDSQTMLLGQIFEFDSPLIFDPSPIRHDSLGSVGEVRLAKPGNRTEEGGSQRWEHVLQHDFELIARGTMRYSLPVSSKMYRALIAGRVVVHPSGDIDDKGNMKLSPSSWRYEPGSNTLLHPPKREVGLEVRVSA